MAEGITSANAFLRDAVKSYLNSAYDNPPIKMDEDIDPNLGWRPTLNSPINNHLMVVEASEKVYPLIFRMRRAEMAEVQSPHSGLLRMPRGGVSAKPEGCSGPREAWVWTFHRERRRSSHQKICRNTDRSAHNRE